jgi:hypothetical protein
MKFCHSLFICLLLAASSVAAYARPFPDNAQTGTLKGYDLPMVKIGSETLRLAPGARIFNQTNIVVLPTSLPDSAKILFQYDITGMVLNLWLLDDDEVAALKKAGKKF